MTRERNAVLGSVVLWGILLFLFGGIVLTYQVIPYPDPVGVFDPGYDAYREALTEAMASSLTWMLSLVVAIIALYKLLKGISKWYVMGDRPQEQTRTPTCLDF